MRQIGQNFLCSARSIFWVSIVVALSGCVGTWCCFADEPKKLDQDDELKRIVDPAAEFTIEVGTDPVRLEFHETPILRWPNAVRGTPLGGTFIWTKDDRPEVIACMFEMTNPADGKASLWFAFQSLSPNPITAKKGDKSFWSCEKADVEFKNLEGAPPPADTAPKRLAQMKEIGKRFSARVDNLRTKEELRLLPTQLYRYKSGDIIDGAIFTFAQGTDPEVMLHLEARRLKKDKEEVTQWQYAISRRSAFALEVMLDDEEVWAVKIDSGTPETPFYQGPFPQEQ